MIDLRKVSKCQSCEAPIVWCETPTGHAIPIDAEPVDDGNVLLLPTIDRTHIAVVLGQDEARETSATVKRYKAHFATCPDAASFRKSRKVRP